MSSLPPAIDTALTTYEQSINELESQLDLLLNLPNLRDLTDTLSSMECAQLYTTLSYTLNSLYHNFLRITGKSLDSHPIKNELDRVRDYMKKLKELEIIELERANMAHIDKSAATRFIKHALNNNDNRDSLDNSNTSSRNEYSIDSTPMNIDDNNATTSFKNSQMGKKLNNLPSSNRSLPHKENVVTQFSKMKQNK